jgi:nitrous oxidase accessory protein NosD
VKHGSYAESLEISTNRIRLVGQNATLTQPATPAKTFCNKMAATPEKATGICVFGQVATPGGGTPEVVKPVKRVKISGFTISKFGGDGVFIFGGKGTVLRNSRLLKNGGYGSFSNTSSGTSYLHNVARGNSDAGFYVGDSPKANATVKNNVSIGNHYGVLLRNASHGKVSNNVLTGNCAGLIVLADAPGPAGFWTVQNNTASRNNKACAAVPADHEPALSGIGIGLSGANDTKVLGNTVNGNKNTHPSFASGGIVVLKGEGGTVPANDLVKKNQLSKNSPFDIDWDSTGTVTFKKNTCTTSTPSGLCS